MTLTERLQRNQQKPRQPRLLERYFRGQLDDARRESTADHARLRCSNRGIRGGEIDVVEGVEKLATNIEAEPLPNGEVAYKPKIHIEVGGSREDAGSRVAEGELRGRGESRGVEPVIDRLLAIG